MDQDYGEGATIGPSYGPDFGACSGGMRLCENGECIPKSDLCPQEEEMNENTILIMVVIGAAVLIFLVILYFFQQRAQNSNRNNTANPGTFENIVGDGDNTSLNLPPPTYNEVITTDLYPPTPNTQRSTQITESEEPITPPPNYDTALHILARSHDNICNIKNDSPVIRRSLSSDIGSSVRRSPSRVSGADLQRNFSSPEDRP